jgi:hypothetical protein
VRNGASDFLTEAGKMEREGGGGGGSVLRRKRRNGEGGVLVECDVEWRRTGPDDRQLLGSGRDGRRSVTCEAGETRREADGWGSATVPRFQTR